LGGTLLQNTAIDQAGYNLEFTNTLASGRTTEIHAGNDVIGAGVQGVGFTTQNAGMLGYLFTGDASSTGGSPNQSGIGLTNFSTLNGSIGIYENAGDMNGSFSVGSTTGSTSIDLSSNGNMNMYSSNNVMSNYINTYYDTATTNPTYVVSVSNPSKSNTMTLGLDDVTFSQYLSNRDDSATFTPVNFLYTDTNGKVLSAPVSALGGSGWSLTGNAGTTAGTNFIGTTDAQDFMVKTNGNQIALFGQSGNVTIGSSIVLKVFLFQ
jgi:hypothetical protein